MVEVTIFTSNVDSEKVVGFWHESGVSSHGIDFRCIDKINFEKYRKCDPCQYFFALLTCFEQNAIK